MISPLFVRTPKCPCSGQSAFLYSVLDQAEVEETGQRVLKVRMLKVRLILNTSHLASDLGRTLIKDLTIQVPAASKGCHCRPTGAGKSTLINLLMRFYLVNSGEITIDGVPITDYTRASYPNSLVWFCRKPGLRLGRFMKISPFFSSRCKQRRSHRSSQSGQCRFLHSAKSPQGYDTYLSDAGEFFVSRTTPTLNDCAGFPFSS